MRFLVVAVFLLATIGVTSRARAEMTLDNGSFALRLGSEGLILSAAWKGEEAVVFEDAGAPAGLEDWVPRPLLPGAVHCTPWRRNDTAVFLRAESDCPLTQGLRLTWVVELAKTGSLFRTQVCLANEGSEKIPVEWFPAWHGTWRVKAGARRLRWWEPLTYLPVERDVVKSAAIVLQSRLHSSDDITEGAAYPYWLVDGDDHHRLCFGLSWCGGWQATLEGDGETLSFDVRLPENETQLVLAPGESVGGPIMSVTCLRGANDRENRAAWLHQRASLARELYGGPAPAYPLAYNNWYETRFGADGDFFDRQVAAMEPYGFDAFVIDAGWYQAVGQWTPDPAKFSEGQFENMMKSVKEKGVTPGIWSCPQFVQAKADALPPEVDQPGMYRKFIDGYLLDYAGMDFSGFLESHVRALRERYHADWWKYDQDFFTGETRHGVMKNVLAFQEALVAVRKAEPDLVIESCQSGGRMINELTVLTAQTQWLRDGGESGLPLIRKNIYTGLRAIEFLFPWQAGRWTNRPNDMPKNEELTRCLCRSAMMGNWGIVADLDKIEAWQRPIILEEIARYRRLNTFKEGYRYDLTLPLDGAAVAGVTFYSPGQKGAAALLYRWESRDALEHTLSLDGLEPAKEYRAEDVDTGNAWTVTGAALAEKGLSVAFPKKRLSAIIFIDAIP